MKKHSVAAIVAVSIAAPLPAAADLKDALLGAAVGAIIQNEVSKSKRAKQSAPQRKASGTARSAAPATLNSTYSRQERVQIQAAFRDLGYPIGAVDGVLGKNSRRIIGQYQASRGEAQTGQLTRPQYVALISQASGGSAVFAARPLNGDEVRMLQQGLQTLGYYGGAIDGSNGPGTRGALNAYLGQQGYAPNQFTPVQSLVLTRNAAGLPTAIYLQQEAGAQYAAARPNPGFGVQPQQQLQAGFGAQGQAPQPTNPFAPTAPAQQVNPLFAAPQQQPVQGQGQFTAPQQQFQGQGQGQFAVAPAQQPQPVFGAPQQQQVGVPQQPKALFQTQPQQQVQPQQQPTTLFAPAPQPAAPAGTQAPATAGQQNLFAPTAPQPAVPQAPVPQNGTTLFAAGTQAQQPVATAPQAASNLDIFSGSGTQPSAPQPNQLVSQ